MIDSFTKNGGFLMLALDHRESFRKLISPNDPQGVEKEIIIDIKKEIIEALLDQISGLLIDVEYGLPAYQKVLGEVREEKPFLLPAEKSGYREENGERYSELQYSARELKNLGASGVKLLLYFHPEGQSAPQQIELAKRVQDESKAEKLPLFIEIVTYEIEGKNNDKSSIVVGSVKMFLEKGILPDVFKLEFPDTSDSCSKITQLLGKTPWILLTRGESFDKFKQDLQIAIQNGASGFLAGRSLWQDFVSLDEKERKDGFQTVSKKRFEEIVEIVNSV